MSFQYFPTKGLCLVKTNNIQIEELKKALAQEKEIQIRESNDRPAYQKNGLFFKESKIKTVGKKIRIACDFNLPDYCLSQEYENLLKTQHTNLTPIPVAIIKQGVVLPKNEMLISEYYPCSKTLDDVLRSEKNQATTALRLAIKALVEAVQSGFVHLDSNPGNILFSKENEPKLIDLESVHFNPPEPEFCIGLTVGFLYHFWVNKYLDEANFDEIAFDVISRRIRSNEKFVKAYLYSKLNKIDRKLKKTMLDRNKPYELLRKA